MSFFFLPSFMRFRNAVMQFTTKAVVAVVGGGIDNIVKEMIKTLYL